MKPTRRRRSLRAALFELPRAVGLLPQLARRAVTKGFDDDFATLKQILEATRRYSHIA